MPAKQYKVMFSDYQQGPLTATYLFTHPIAPKQDPGIDVEDQHKASEILSRISKAQNTSLVFIGKRVSDKAKLLNQFAYRAKRTVCLIDCPSLAGNYIGETEKNLSRLIADASTENWILFFDEADALFGKRSKTEDVHDKYANQEVSYLLKRIGQHHGLYILSITEPSQAKAVLPRVDYTISFR